MTPNSLTRLERLPQDPCFKDAIDSAREGITVADERADFILAEDMARGWKSFDLVHASATKFVTGKRAKLTGETKMLLRNLKKKGE